MNSTDKQLSWKEMAAVLDTLKAEAREHDKAFYTEMQGYWEYGPPVPADLYTPLLAPILPPRSFTKKTYVVGSVVPKVPEEDLYEE